jgi:hypothetical protein
VAELQQKYDEQREHGFESRSDEEWLRTPESVGNERLIETDIAILQLRDWYDLLVRTSNCVFQIEYWSRVLGRALASDRPL